MFVLRLSFEEPREKISIIRFDFLIKIVELLPLRCSCYSKLDNRVPRYCLKVLKDRVLCPKRIEPRYLRDLQWYQLRFVYAP